MLPEKFTERMKNLLGENFSAFLSMLDENAVRGLRINTLKCEREDFLSKNNLPLSPISYTDTGFILESQEQVGRLAEHHSGRIYMQDPGAMAPLSAIKIPKGARVIDLCAAPGGKSGQAAAMIGDDGFILSNEFLPKRAKILVSNFERLGIKNAIVTSMDTAKLCELYSDFFDYAIVDAPCSGEGMFRKNDLAAEEWSEENVKISSERQREILNNASRLVRGGGYIIYSTCTYSPEENEKTLDDFLNTHPEFSPVPLPEKILEATAPALTYGVNCKNVRYARRFYPHISKGEGQFLAVIQKHRGDLPTLLYKNTEKPLVKAENELVYKFLKDTLFVEPSVRITKSGNNILLLPKSLPPLPPHSVFMAGVLLGEIQKGRLIPSHQFFSAYGSIFRTRIELSDTDSRLEAYLSGEEISAPQGADDGYCVITYKGSALGGGKISGGKIKNHYPKGLRNRKL